MDIFNEIKPLRAFLNSRKEQKSTIGLVPTMGALHPGHISLIKASKNENQFTICSIYVNPTQFDNQADLERYPKTYEEDVKLLIREQCDALFLPSNDEMYGVSSTLKFDFGNLDKVLEGKYRPGHFSGVGIVVAKLLNIVQPDRVYFGQKDYQQFRIIETLKEELKFPLQVCSVPIVREASGLALSSRNQHLSNSGKSNAVLLFESLKFAVLEIRNKKEISIIRAEIESRFRKKDGMKLEYFELADQETLETLDRVNPNGKSMVLIAAYVDDVRLIDNMLVEL